LPAVRSIYRWEGRIEESSETLVLFKTTRNRFDDLQRRLRALHSYEVPEIVALPLAEGLPEYLRWVGESCA
ncbi:MAG: divalent-cation tolerance protein CutA, partial [Chthoniobacterales bacterium]|nr:divalent-cation tolerance protein CutA [Chthoniobacterales bacterium]